LIACLSIPGFDLKAAMRRRPALATKPAALAPEPGGEPLIGPVNASAELVGVRPGMRLGEALATCPGLVLVEPDPAAAEQAWEEIVCGLEDAGFAVEPAAGGVAYFETRGVERLYGGLDAALQRALAAAGGAWDARIGAAGRRFAALAAASVARPGQVLVVRDEEVGNFLAPLPLTLLPLEQRRAEELHALGVR
jgi:nucleotidyltransferase/DNA polymerase involved in DNA repair